MLIQISFFRLLSVATRKDMRKKAFTLIEMVVTVAVMSIVAFSLLYIMLEGFKVWWVNRDYIGLASDGKAVINRIASEAYQAESFTFVHAEEIVLYSDIDNDGYAQSIKYYIENAGLYRDEEGLDASINPAVMSEDVSSISFNWESPILTIGLTMTKGDDTLNLRRKAFIRCIPY